MVENQQGLEIYHIYDKIFKKILTLSGPAVINLINGLFETNYSLNSKLTYNWTEFVDGSLKRVLADTIITVNDKYPYHMEAQMENDDDIVFRVFDYGYKHAELNKTSAKNNEDIINYSLTFPTPKIIYLDSCTTTPDSYTLEINFAAQGSFLYKIDTFKLQNYSADELSNKKLIILIPFLLLKLRKLISQERTPDNIRALQQLIEHDILNNIDKNVAAGNLTLEDGLKLKRMTSKLYKHIYSKYKEMEEIDKMTDESIMFDIDIMEKEHEERMARMAAELEDVEAKLENTEAKLENTEAKLENTEAKLENAERELENAIAERDNAIAEKIAEIEKLKEEISRLNKIN